MARLADYRELSKSGIVALVLISVLGGFLIGHPLDHPFDLPRLILTLLGVLLLASGSSALNQIQDQAMDAKMERTKNRPLPSGRITPVNAMIFVGLTAISGLTVLWILSPTLLWMGLSALVSYNGLYTLWWKRKWAYAAIPGAIPGALPIWMGHTAASDQLISAGGLYLFFILFFWQMPHFWVLALKYREDYRQGGVPTLPVSHGLPLTVAQIAAWCLGFVALAMGAPLFLRVGVFYEIVAALMSVKLLIELYAFAKLPETKKWLHFFLWVNFALIIYIAALAADLWSVYLAFWTAR